MNDSLTLTYVSKVSNSSQRHTNCQLKKTSDTHSDQKLESTNVAKGNTVHDVVLLNALQKSDMHS